MQSNRLYFDPWLVVWIHELDFDSGFPAFSALMACNVYGRMRVEEESLEVLNVVDRGGIEDVAGMVRELSVYLFGLIKSLRTL